MMPFDQEESTQTRGAQLGDSTLSESGRHGRPHLLVFSNGTTAIIHLPEDRGYVVGRARDVDLPIEDSSMSRQHVALNVHEGQVTIEDLGSLNGTRVNGQRVEQPLRLRSGDVISMGSTQMVFQRASATPPRWNVLDADAFEIRLHAEVERSLRYLHPMSVLLLRLGGGIVDEPVGHDLLGALRTMDLVARLDAGAFAILLPEVTPVDGRFVGERLLRVLQRHDSAARGGLASWPDDAMSPDALMEAARAALDRAEPGHLATAQDSVRNVKVGNHLVSFADAAMIRLYSLVERVAGTDLPILVCGETGVGKEVFASAVHMLSERSRGTLVAVNCAALPESLAESELFGHARGAFTGAQGDRVGLIEGAHGGTLFLDEIGEMPLPMQAKLLRVLQEGQLSRLGENRVRRVDVRLVCATNRDLREESTNGRFRKDLYFRISAVTLLVPPLRERPREIPILARTFAEQVGRQRGLGVVTLTSDTLRALSVYSWPGNVRELRNVMERTVATATSTTIEPWMLPIELGGEPDVHPIPTPHPTAAHGSFRSLQEEVRELEQSRIRQALEASGGHQGEAARLLQMPLRTLENKIKAYGLRGIGRARRE